MWTHFFLAFALFSPRFQAQTALSLFVYPTQFYRCRTAQSTRRSKRRQLNKAPSHLAIPALRAQASKIHSTLLHLSLSLQLSLSPCCSALSKHSLFYRFLLVSALATAESSHSGFDFPKSRFSACRHRHSVRGIHLKSASSLALPPSFCSFYNNYLPL